MDRFQYRKKNLQYAAGILAAYLLIILFFNGVLIAPRKNKLKGINQELKVMNTKLQEYRDFKNTVNELEDRKRNIKKLIDDFYTNLIPRDRLEQEFLAEIDKITKQTNIKVEKINIIPFGTSSRSQSGYEKQVWQLSFYTSFKNFMGFIHLLESNPLFFGLNKLTIYSGKVKPMHKFEISIYTVIPVTMDAGEMLNKYDISNSTAIFSLPIDSYSMLTMVQKKQKQILPVVSVDSDPFWLGDTIFPELKNKKKRRNIMQKPLPKLVLGGILWDSKAPEVIIDGEVLSKGGYVKGAKVVKITKNSVQLVFEGRRINLKLED